MNQIKLNSNKTYAVSYTSKKETIFNSRYYIQRDIITKQDVMKDLGVTFDSKFTLNQHIEGLLINFFKGETHVPDHQENYVYVFTANTRILLLNMVSNKNSPRQTT